MTTLISHRGIPAVAAATLGLAMVVAAPVTAVEPAAFTVDLTYDWVHGDNFAADSMVAVQIGSQSWESPTDGSGNFSLDLSGWNEQGNEPFDVTPGLTVSVSDSVVTKTTTTPDLRILSFDTTANTISGSTDMPGVHLAVGAQHTNYGDQAIVSVPAPSSLWTADFADASPGPYQVRILDEASAFQTDGDGDQTEVHMQLSMSRFTFSPELQEVVGYEWPDGASVTLTVNRGGGAPEYSATALAGAQCDSRDTCQSEYMPTGNGNVWFGFVGGSFLALPGDVMSMSDGITTKTQAIPDLRVDVQDTSNDTVSGMTDAPMPPGSFLVTHSGYPWSNGGVHHDVTAASDGSWWTSYSGETEVDGAAAVQYDVDGDATAVAAPRPDVRVDPAADRVWAIDFGAGSVQLVIERAASQVFSMSVATTNVLTRGSWNLDMWTEPTGTLPRPTVARFELAGQFDLQSGDQVSVTDGVTTLVVPVALLTVDSVSAVTDIVSGLANETVNLHMGDGESGYWGYAVDPTGGAWSYYFEPNVFPNPPEGLIPGQSMQAMIGQTLVRFTVPEGGFVFDGFFSPIAMGLTTNKAQAGRAIPVKWRLTDASGAPVTDSASFVGLFTYPVACRDHSGDPAGAVEEYGRGALQSLGDGYWQYNWVPSKPYAGTCRAMYVEFFDGTTSPVAYFTFKR